MTAARIDPALDDAGDAAIERANAEALFPRLATLSEEKP
jgi:hypothetical protein